MKAATAMERRAVDERGRGGGEEGGCAGRERSLYTCTQLQVSISMHGWRNIQSSTCMSVALNYSSHMYCNMTFIGGAARGAWSSEPQLMGLCQ